MNSLSICIAVKNRSKLLTTGGEVLALFPNCLKSLAESFPFAVESEVIICDFESDDWPLDEWVGNVLNNINYDIIRAKVPFHRGLGRNIAADHSSGDILFFLDADMLVNTHLINNGINYVKQGKIYFPTCFYYLNPENTLGFWSQGKGNVFISRASYLKSGKWPCPPKYRREVYEDTKFYKRLVASGSRVVVQKEEDYYHQYHPGRSVDVVFKRHKPLIIDVTKTNTRLKKTAQAPEPVPMENYNYTLPKKRINVVVNNTKFTVLEHFFYNHHQDLKWEFYTYLIFQNYLQKDCSYIDIGTWIGPTILYAWEIGVKSVYGVEANPNTYKMAIENCKLNNIPAKIQNYCILDKEGWTTFGTPNKKTPTSDLSSAFSSQGNSWNIPTLSLCQYITQHCEDDWNFIKIDIEGAEVYLSADLEKLSIRPNTVIYLSLHPPFWKNKQSEANKLLSAINGYNIKNHHLQDIDISTLEDMMLTSQRKPSWGTKYGNFFEIILESKKNLSQDKPKSTYRVVKSPDHLPEEQILASLLTTSGKYTNGIGKAGIVAKSDTRSMLLKRLFGCALIGTFNIRVSQDIKGIPPTIVEGIHKFNFIKISLPDGQYQYGWCYRFDGSRQKKGIVEVYTKQALPDQFKDQPLKITYLPRWSQKNILEWQKGKYWYQGFDWLPTQRVDSSLLWSLMQHEDYEKKSVLDFGTHYGFFAFQASKKGAIVEAIDIDPDIINMANTINEHIEQQDILFRLGNALPEKEYDFIFELSVYHSIDRTYQKLPQHLEELKKRCRVLFLELVNPPFKGHFSQEEVDGMVGGEKLLHYRHKVRRMRTLYKVKGYL